MEFSRIKGIAEKTKRELGVNLTAGPVNAIELCEKVLGAPSLDQLVDLFEVEFGKKQYTDGLDMEMEMGMKSPVEEINVSLL